MPNAQSRRHSDHVSILLFFWVEFSVGEYFLKTTLERFRSNLVFDVRYHFILECSTKKILKKSERKGIDNKTVLGNFSWWEAAIFQIRKNRQKIIWFFDIRITLKNVFELDILEYTQTLLCNFQFSNNHNVIFSLPYYKTVVLMTQLCIVI